MWNRVELGRHVFMGHNSVIDLLKTAQFCDAGPLAESWREEVVEKLWRLVVMS